MQAYSTSPSFEKFFPILAFLPVIVVKHFCIVSIYFYAFLSCYSLPAFVYISLFFFFVLCFWYCSCCCINSVTLHNVFTFFSIVVKEMPCMGRSLNFSLLDYCFLVNYFLYSYYGYNKIVKLKNYIKLKKIF